VGHRRIAASIAALLALLAGGCAVFSTSTIDVDRDWDYEDVEPMGPDSFVDRFGEPDLWKKEGKDANLRMTAVWNCLEGKKRTVVWRIDQVQAGRQYWRVITDRLEDGQCEQPAAKKK